MSTQPSWSTTLSGDTGTTWFVRLDVTDTQNQVAESFRSVVLFTGCDPGTICAALASIAESRLDNDSETGNLDGVKVRTTETDGADFITSGRDRKSTRLNSSHVAISYAVFCLKKKNIRDTRSN